MKKWGKFTMKLEPMMAATTTRALGVVNDDFAVRGALTMTSLMKVTPTSSQMLDIMKK